MSSKNDKWSALSMKERADLINMYITNGISELKEMKKHYNSFGPGGEVETKENSPIKDIARDLAYKIIVQKGVSDKGKANIGEIITGIANTKPIVDDNKKMFLYGNINGLYPASDDKGFDFTSYLQQNYPDRVIKSYQGEINPYGEYVFDEKVKGLIEEMAKKKKHIYSNADDEYLHHVTIPNPDTRNNPTAEFMDVGYRDDVHSYPLKFDVDSNGNPIAHAADLYDFNAKEYLKEFKPIKAFQAHLLTSVGNPYILRQDNIPVKFIDLNEKSDYSPRVNYNGSIYDNDLTDEERRAVNFNWILKNITDEKVANILDSGYIEPAVVTVESKKSNGGRILDGTEEEQTTTGLPVGAGLATYNHPKYNHPEEAEMYSYLRSRGVPHVQASAIMGNIAVESMLNPEITQIGGGGGYGLIQATDKSRKNAFINYDGQPYEFGSNISPETQRQLDYIIDKGLTTQTRGEWRGNDNIGRASVARRKFLEATDINKASKIFTENYLRPGKPHTKRRKSMSNYFNDNYGITERALEEFENSFLFQNN